MEARVVRRASEGIRAASGPTPTLYKIAGFPTCALSIFCAPRFGSPAAATRSDPNLTLAHVACHGFGTIPKQGSIQTSIITRMRNSFITPDHIPSTAPNSLQTDAERVSIQASNYNSRAVAKRLEHITRGFDSKAFRQGSETVPKQSSIQTSIITRKHHLIITPEHIPSTSPEGFQTDAERGQANLFI